MAGTAAPTAHVDLSANHNAEIIAIITVFSTMALLTLISRFLSRHMKRQRYMLDDWLLVAAWIFALTESVLSGVGIKYDSFGYHVATMTPEKVVSSQKALFAGTFMQTTSMTLAKLSVLILLHLVFHVEQGFKRTCWILGAITVLWWLGVTCGYAFVCFPASRMWSPSKGGHCGKHTVMDFVVPIPWLLTDLAILIAPLTAIRRLEMLAAWNKKVYAAFFIGTMTCIVAILQYHTLFYNMADFSWTLVDLAEWNLIELFVSIMCPALMAFKPAVSWLRKKLFPKWTFFPSDSRDPTRPSFVQTVDGSDSSRNDSTSLSALKHSTPERIHISKVRSHEEHGHSFQTVPDFLTPTISHKEKRVHQMVLFVPNT